MKKFNKLLNICMIGLTISTVTSVASCSKDNNGPLTQKEVNKTFFYFANNNTDSNYVINADFSLALADGEEKNPQWTGQCKIQDTSKDHRNDKRIEVTVYDATELEKFRYYDFIMTRNDHFFHYLKKKKTSSEISNQYNLKALYPSDYNEILPFIEQKYNSSDFFSFWTNWFYFPAYIIPIIFSVFEWNSQNNRYEFKITDDEEFLLQLSFGINAKKQISEFDGVFYTDGGSGFLEVYAKVKAQIEYDNAEIKVPEFNAENIKHYDRWFKEITDLTQEYEYSNFGNNWYQIKIKPTKNEGQFNAIVGPKGWLDSNNTCLQIYKDDTLLVEKTEPKEAGDYYISDLKGENPTIVFTEPFEPTSAYHILSHLNENGSKIHFEKR